MREVFIAAGSRTPIGIFGGSLKNIDNSLLGSMVIDKILQQAGVRAEEVQEVIMGNCFPTAECGGNPARLAAIRANIPVEVPSFTVFENCTSGLRAVALAAKKIAAGEVDIVVAGGVENMSQVPYISPHTRWGTRLGHAELLDFIRVAMYDPLSGYHMGETAENLADKYNISREEQDLWALMSQQRAEKAIKDGIFKEEIVPVVVPTKKGNQEFIQDEHPIFGTTIESLSRLHPAFKKNGTVTAGNSSGLNDAAAALLLVSEKRMKELTVQPLAKVVDAVFVGVHPSVMGIAPAPATKKLLAKVDMSLDDADLIECNEAFAAQIIAVERELKWNREKINIYGSGISLGHPVGATGARLLVTIIHALRREKKKRGLVTMCAGGGLGGAMLVENLAL